MPDPTDKPTAANPAPEPREHIVSTEHSLLVAGRTLEYTATCGTVLLRLYNETADVSSEATDGAGAATFSAGANATTAIWTNLRLRNRGLCIRSIPPRKTADKKRANYNPNPCNLLRQTVPKKRISSTRFGHVPTGLHWELWGSNGINLAPCILRE